MIHPFETRTPEQIAAEDYPYSASAAWEKEWATAQPWRRLSSDVVLQPGHEMRFAVGPVTDPYVVSQLVAMADCLPDVRVKVVLNGRFCLFDDARFDMDRVIKTPRFMMLPHMLMQVCIKNAGSEPGTFRALIHGKSFGPTQVLEFYMTNGYQPIADGVGWSAKTGQTTTEPEKT